MRAGALPAAPTIRPAIRIRTVLLCAGLALVPWWALPRVRAAFQLYSAATAFADYALCMVGPTGPSLLRDNPREFWRLARRKLVSSAADDRPFKKCEKSARLISDSAVSREAHQAPASMFGEWGAETEGAPPGYALSDLGVGTRLLAELSERAWPFVRDGYTALVRPSSYASESAHPLEPPRPGTTRGPVPHRSLTRCTSPDGADFAMDLSSDRRWKIIRSSAGATAPSEVRLAPAEARIFSLSCDADKAVIGFGREGSRDVELVVCTRGGGCDRMPLPRLSSNGASVRFPLDVVRVDGTTVIVTTMRGIVRVGSTRDDGRSWTPLTVAFDPVEGHGAGEAAARLVAAGRRIFVVGNAASSGGYWVLASDDAGASWHAP